MTTIDPMIAAVTPSITMTVQLARRAGLVKARKAPLLALGLSVAAVGGLSWGKGGWRAELFVDALLGGPVVAGAAIGLHERGRQMRKKP
tara:strand:- start:117 stop:383 length:267 start_codon:yes stop_codon:yes gene_type:complete